jgi:hypothetical protein
LVLQVGDHVVWSGDGLLSHGSYLRENRLDDGARAARRTAEGYPAGHGRNLKDA